MSRGFLNNYLADQRTAVKIAIIYLVIGSLWILFSDLLLLGLVTDPNRLALLEILKGWIYVFATTGLLYVLIKRGMQALQLSEGRYRLLFEQANDANLELRRQALIFQHLTDAIIVTDLERRIIDWNPAAEKMFGYTKAQILGQPTEVLHPPAASQTLGKSIIEETTESGYWQGEISYIRGDGSTGVCETTIVPLFDEQGTPIARIGVNRDLTERRQLEAQLRQAQKMEAVGRLAGGIAHDFNNLLTVINGNAEFLLDRHVEPDNPLRHDLDQIIRAGNRAADLTRRLLAFSRQQVLQPQALNLNHVVIDLEKMLRRLIGEDVELITALAPDLAPIEVDPTQLEQIIMNLVLNARDAMPAGGRLTIETANVELDRTYARQNIEVEPGRYVVLAVTDTGQGIDAGTQVKIFEPFFTTKGQEQGTGLGLSTVYGIVTQSGGHIKVYSEPGWGSIFKVYLPQTVNEARPVSVPPVSSQSFQGTETILLVEDESGVRDFVEQLLTGYGYTVLAAARADEAAALGRQYAGRIDLLLTDVILPDLTGPELAQQLAGDLMPALKVLYMSGYAGRAVLVNGVVETNRTFIQKPFSPDALARQVRDLLDQPES